MNNQRDCFAWPMKARSDTRWRRNDGRMRVNVNLQPRRHSDKSLGWFSDGGSPTAGNAAETALISAGRRSSSLPPPWHEIIYSDGQRGKPSRSDNWIVGPIGGSLLSQDRALLFSLFLRVSPSPNGSGQSSPPETRLPPRTLSPLSPTCPSFWNTIARRRVWQSDTGRFRSIGRVCWHNDVTPAIRDSSKA